MRNLLMHNQRQKRMDTNLFTKNDYGDGHRIPAFSSNQMKVQK